MSAADARRVVLLVEDDADDAELTLLALARPLAPYRVVTARDGVEAVELLLGKGAGGVGLAPGQLALIVLDLNLPRVNGVELLVRLKEAWGDDLGGVKVAVVSSSYVDSEIKLMKDLGASLHIQKPVSREQNETMVRELSRLLEAPLSAEGPRSAGPPAG